ncbi:DUF3558 family protein [Antrihabitans sp. NCIMB 15449]|uniref:DUF3558 family protein n=1 Tax=Antrihabitans spumae TaxID=3373370 RepID=A0ABW7JRB5_9NOCA
MRALTLCGAALLVAGCSTTMEGAPTVSSTEPVALFNPCDIPDDALIAAGVNPRTEESGVGGVGFEGWELCGWEATAGWYFLTVFSTDHAYTKVKLNRALTNFVDATAGTRTGSTSSTSGNIADTCNFAFPAEQGSIMIGVVAKYKVPRPEEPCTTALTKAAELDTYLPQ